MLELINEHYGDLNFNFIRESIHKKHVHKLLTLINNSVCQDCSFDSINKFYNEFQIYDKNNEGSMGIVLTPNDIVEMMVKELQLENNQTVLDTCTGTGTFLIGSTKVANNLKLVGCENNEERYTLAKCNFILNDLDSSNLHHDSCFNVNFPKCDRMIINPPFSCNCNDELTEENITNWKNFKDEQKFLLHAIQYLKPNGIGVAIIPRSNFKNSKKKYETFKIELLKHIIPTKVINCNSKVFAPVASVECAIITFVKKNDSESTVVKTNSSLSTTINDGKQSKITNDSSSLIVTIDYREDGYEVRKKVRIKVKEPTIKISSAKCIVDGDWNYENKVELLSYEEIVELVEKYNIEYSIYKYNQKKGIVDYSPLNLYRSFREFTEVIPMDEINGIYNLYLIHPRVGDYFDQISKSKVRTTLNTNEGNYPLISSTSKNNGVMKLIDTWDFDGYYLTVNRTGSCGYCFVQNGKFSVTEAITLLKPKDSKLNLHVWATLLTNKLSNKYNYTNGLSIPKLMNEEL
ncbi:MAG: N-6 DNA methylase [Acholeplasmataceae bacterium]